MDFDQIGSNYSRNCLRHFEIVTEIVLAGTRRRLRIQPKMFSNVRERRIAKERLPRREY